jgi:hypothetical protein
MALRRPTTQTSCWATTVSASPRVLVHRSLPAVVSVLHDAVTHTLTTADYTETGLHIRELKKSEPLLDSIMGGNYYCLCCCEEEEIGDGRTNVISCSAIIIVCQVPTGYVGVESVDSSCYRRVLSTVNKVASAEVAVTRGSSPQSRCHLVSPLRTE